MLGCCKKWLLLINLSLCILQNFLLCTLAFTPTPPKVSPATLLPNQLYRWRQDQQIRYQVAGDENAPPVLLIHGLFVNSDHWRKTLKDLARDGYRAYAIGLWGCGYSSKPPYDSPEAQAANGENRFRKLEKDESVMQSVLPNVKLGTASGGERIADVDLRHPLGSPYNFFSWAELITDFCQDVIHPSYDEQNNGSSEEPLVSLVCNSIGTISSLQAILDEPKMFKGVFVVSPNFRELHSAEIPLPQFSMPIVRTVQRVLRERGQPLFEALAKPDIVKNILKEPYFVQEAVDDTLVQVLLDPLLTPGASDVVFDTLSYSAGPLPEQQLSHFPSNVPVWICYGENDPWTPGERVEALAKMKNVEKVVGLPGVGHCPHDEAPDMVHPLLLEFLERVNS